MTNFVNLLSRLLLAIHNQKKDSTMLLRLTFLSFFLAPSLVIIVYALMQLTTIIPQWLSTIETSILQLQFAHQQAPTLWQFLRTRN